MAFPKVVTGAASLRRLPRGQLLDIIETFAIEGEPANANRWLMGVTWQPEPCRDLFTGDVDVCARIDFTDFAPGCENAITQTAFSVYDALKGSLPDMTPEEIEALLLMRVRRKISSAFASELLSGAASGDRALRKDATSPVGLAFGSGATPIWNALPVIEAELSRRLDGSVGTIHMPPGMLSRAVQRGALLLIDGQWETPLGHIVIADAGYINAPQPTGGGGASAAGEDWIYGSGPVRYRMTEPKAVDASNIGSTITNFTGVVGSGQAPPAFGTRDVSTRFVAAYGILIWDPCPVTAVLVTYDEDQA